MSIIESAKSGPDHKDEVGKQFDCGVRSWGPYSSGEGSVGREEAQNKEADE